MCVKPCKEAYAPCAAGTSLIPPVGEEMQRLKDYLRMIRNLRFRSSYRKSRKALRLSTLRNKIPFLSRVSPVESWKPIVKVHRVLRLATGEYATMTRFHFCPKPTQTFLGAKFWAEPMKEDPHAGFLRCAAVRAHPRFVLGTEFHPHHDTIRLGETSPRCIASVV